MTRYKYTKKEMQINKIYKYQDDRLKSISYDDESESKKRIKESEDIIRGCGYGDELEDLKNKKLSFSSQESQIRQNKPTWKEIVYRAEQKIKGPVYLESLFTPEELRENEKACLKLNNDFNQLHKLDSYDIAICVLSGLISATLDILMVGIPRPTTQGLKAGPLSNYIRKYFESKFPPDKMKKLGEKIEYKTPYDAQDNRNTIIPIEGLSSYYHRLYSLGHDPILGFVVGVFDIMKNRMTTIDKHGKFVSQEMGNYTDRNESTIFRAMLRQLRHLKSDITTSMGLPAPLMSLFNFLQFGYEEEQTIAEIVQSMYYEGYDFIHFCSMTIPVMASELIVRICYALKRVKEGHSIKESIPITTNRTKRPKLGTMLFISHTIAASINAGKVYFTQNPLSINFPQWLAFCEYSYKQLKWVLLDKPRLRDKYVQEEIDRELIEIIIDDDKRFEFD